MRLPSGHPSSPHRAAGAFLMPHFTPRSTRQGILFVIIAVACFAAIDVLTKYLSTAIAVGAALWVRYTVQTVVTAVWMVPRRGRAFFRTRHPWLQALRGVIIAASSGTAFIALRTVPVADFSAILMLSPLVITVIAALWLHEQVSVGRWLLLLVAFGGALLVIRPGASTFTWAMLLPLVLVGTSAAFQLLAGFLSREDGAATTHFYTSLAAMGVATVLLPFDWRWPDSTMLWLLVLLLAVFSNLGHTLLVLGFSCARAGVLAPFNYFHVVFAAIGGWLLFDQWPAFWSVIGMVVIVVAGVIGNWMRARQDAARDRADAERARRVQEPA